MDEAPTAPRDEAGSAENGCRLYRVINKARNGTWIVAGSPEEATALAKALGTVRTEPKEVRDQTEFYLKHPTASSLRELLASGRRGVGAVQVDPGVARWILRDLAVPAAGAPC